MSFPNPVEAVIFDMDGLLLDTERIYKVVLQRACTALQYEMSDELFHSLIGVPGQEGYRMLQAHFGPDFPLDAYKSEIGVIAGEMLADGVPLKTGAEDILLALDGWGVPIALATSSNRSVAEGHLTKAGIRKHFELIFTGDEVSKGKPHPEIFEKAVAALGLDAAHCVVLEDSHNGIRAAHAARTMPVMVPDIVLPTDEIRTKCVAVASDLHEVRSLLADRLAP